MMPLPTFRDLPSSKTLDRFLQSSANTKDELNVADKQIALNSYRNEPATRLHLLLDQQVGQSITQIVVRDESALW